MPNQETARILVVDDEPRTCEILSRWLAAAGYVASSAHNGEKALRALEADKFDLVVSDIMMPGISGIEVLKIVRNRYPETAVIMATAVDVRETAISALKLGAYGYMMKPFDRTDFLINVANALERRRLTLMSREYERSLEERIRLYEKYQKLVDVFPVGIAEFLLNQPVSCSMSTEEMLPIIFNARLTDGNPEFARLNGREGIEALHGMRLSKVFPQEEEHLPAYLAWIEHCFSPHVFETRVLNPGGELSYFENTLVGNIEDGRMTGFWGMRRDVTANRQVQEALAQRIRTIDDLYEHVLQAGKARAITDHTAQVAHELRQPLAIIGGFARRLHREAESVDELRPCEPGSTRIIVSEVQRLESILRRLLDFSHHEPVELQKVSPNEHVKYVIDVNGPRLAEKMLSVETRFAHDVHEIFVDPDAFQKLVRNLLANSIEASPFGGVIRIETGISSPRDKAAAGRADLNGDTYYELRIHNHGNPIPLENVRKIFDPFFTTKTYGTGMGLTLSRKIVEDHHGSMSVRSDKEGTLFTVWLPLNNGADEEESDVEVGHGREQDLHLTESVGGY